jgi:drug/metabolite transporter (DMT)-like permease
LALLALVPQLIGHSAFNWALKFLPATYVAVTTLGEPVGSIVLAAKGVSISTLPITPVAIVAALQGDAS